MTTNSNLVIRTQAVGDQQTTSRLNRVRASLSGMATSVRSTFSPILGLGLLTGILGGGLLSIASSGGEASNAMVRLQSIMDRMLAPLFELSNRFLDWFETLSTGQQTALLLGGAITFLARGIIGGVLVRALGTASGAFAAMWAVALGPVGLIIAGILAIAASAYFLYTRFQTLRDGVREYAGIALRSLNFILTGMRQLIAAGLTLGHILRNPAAITDVEGVFRRADALLNDAILSLDPSVEGRLRNLSFRGRTNTPLSVLEAQGGRSSLLRQDGQGLFSLTPGERNLLNRANPFSGYQDPRSRTNRFDQTGGGDTYYNFGITAEQLLREQQRAAGDPALQTRDNGGP